MLSMDALFGLPRKKAAGTGLRGDQSYVDEYVASNIFRQGLSKVKIMYMYSLHHVMDRYI